jgi:DNA-binding response OmpR family regulator
MDVLLVEDDKLVAEFVRQGLEGEHYAVDVVQDGEEAERKLTARSYDLVVLDLNLPHVDGLDVLRFLRGRRASTPVLILTVRGAVEDRVKGLDLGADDYLPKPFAFTELAARVRALVRRNGRHAERILRIADLELDRMTRTVTRRGREISLTPREFALLEYLLRNQGRCVTRAMAAREVWHHDSAVLTNVVDVYINYLRAKVDRDFEPKLIQTIRGVGYTLSESEEVEAA